MTIADDMCRAAGEVRERRMQPIRVEVEADLVAQLKRIERLAREGYYDCTFGLIGKHPTYRKLWQEALEQRGFTAILLRWDGPSAEAGYLYQVSWMADRQDTKLEDSYRAGQADGWRRAREACIETGKQVLYAYRDRPDESTDAISRCVSEITIEVSEEPPEDL